MRKRWDESERQDRLRTHRDQFHLAEQAAARRTQERIQEQLRFKSARELGYRHGEAFCLMVYSCVGRPKYTPQGIPTDVPPCGHKEIFWNSRDGVTPFCTGCPSCGGDLQHIAWSLDKCVPDHVPHHGQGVWRDGTPDEAEAFMRHRLAQYNYKDRPDYLTPEYIEEMVARVRDPADEGNTEFRRGWPMLYRHDVMKADSNG